jgi:AraC-like DNA-binding protein
LRVITGKGAAHAATHDPDPARMIEPTRTLLNTVFTTAGAPPDEALDLFDRFHATSDCPMRALSPDTENFWATVRVAHIGPMELTELTTAGARIARTPSLVRAADPEKYAFVVPLSGRLRLTQANRETELRAGWMALCSSSRPFELQLTAEDGPVRLIRARVPGTLLTRSPGHLEDLLATRICGHHGVGRLFTWLVSDLAFRPAREEVGEYLPSDLHRLGNLALDLFEAVLAHEHARTRPPKPHDSLVARVTSFIRENLEDPDLTPETVAAAHHISVSYLHKLFEGRRLSVAASIRAQRLDRARRDLADPHLADLAIHRIAARWGFRSHTSFTRAFRARFGLAPQTVRARAGAARRAHDQVRADELPGDVAPG